MGSTLRLVEMASMQFGARVSVAIGDEKEEKEEMKRCPAKHFRDGSRMGYADDILHER